MIAPLLIVLSSINQLMDDSFGSLKKFDKIWVKFTINSYVSFLSEKVAKNGWVQVF
jgi:hypothetical protein